jgi:hypothetical protein
MVTLPMLTYKFVWASGYSAHMTLPQYERMCHIANEYELPHTCYVHPGPIGSKCIMIRANDMWYGVEEDGWIHT